MSDVKTLVHVRVGGDMGDGQPPWIPENEDLEPYRKKFQEALGDNFVVVVTHYLVEAIVYEN